VTAGAPLVGTDRTRRTSEQRYLDSPYHHGSHRALLHREPDHRGTADVDAIVVPTVNPPEVLVDAAALAAALDRPLVVLSSGRSSARAVVSALGAHAPKVLAVDVPDLDEHPLLGFITSTINRSATRRRVDTGSKRNLGLLLARMAGWDRILFLDDDVVADHSDVRRAAGLLDRYDSVGLAIGGFPDNSVVCHAHRIANGRQDTFVGGGALAVRASRTTSFFPEIYNEDWFYLLDFFVQEGRGCRPVAVTGRAVQRPYDPFADPGRAEAEEFGDVLAEGLFWLLDQGRGLKDATEPFWACFLEQRKLFIGDVARRIRRQEMDVAVRDGILLSLKAAQARRQEIPVSLCTQYLSAWAVDRRRWREVLGRLPRGLRPVEAVRSLGLRPHTAARDESPAGITPPVKPRPRVTVVARL